MNKKQRSWTWLGYIFTALAGLLAGVLIMRGCRKPTGKVTIIYDTLPPEIRVDTVVIEYELPKPDTVWQVDTTWKAIEQARLSSVLISGFEGKARIDWVWNDTLCRGTWTIPESELTFYTYLLDSVPHIATVVIPSSYKPPSKGTWGWGVLAEAASDGGVSVGSEFSVWQRRLRLQVLGNLTRLGQEIAGKDTTRQKWGEARLQFYLPILTK